MCDSYTLKLHTLKVPKLFDKHDNMSIKINKQKSIYMLMKW